VLRAHFLGSFTCAVNFFEQCFLNECPKAWTGGIFHFV